MNNVKADQPGNEHGEINLSHEGLQGSEHPRPRGPRGNVTEAHGGERNETEITQSHDAGDTLTYAADLLWHREGARLQLFQDRVKNSPGKTNQQIDADRGVD